MSTNPTHLEQQNQTEQQNKAPVSSIRTHSGFTLWLDGLRCKLTVHAWRRRTKKARRHHHSHSHSQKCHTDQGRQGQGKHRNQHRNANRDSDKQHQADDSEGPPAAGFFRLFLIASVIFWNRATGGVFIVRAAGILVAVRSKTGLQAVFDLLGDLLRAFQLPNQLRFPAFARIVKISPVKLQSRLPLLCRNVL